MWRPSLNFVSLHYAYILTCTLLAFIIFVGDGNVSTTDAFFFAASCTTESGLNPVDVKALKLYQQLVIYFFPIITNVGFVNIVVVIARLRWYKKAMREHVRFSTSASDAQDTLPSSETATAPPTLEKRHDGRQVPSDHVQDTSEQASVDPKESRVATIQWAEEVRNAGKGKALRVPGPRDRERGAPLEEVDLERNDDDRISVLGRRNRRDSSLHERISHATTTVSVDRIASSLFVIGQTAPMRKTQSRSLADTRAANISGEQRPPKYELEDPEKMGGIEYRSLKLMLKVAVGYFVGLHLLGVLCLLPWIYRSPAKYHEYLAEQGNDRAWWAIYTSQTMISNLGFTLTPDSMVHFADATWPLLVMTFLAYAGNTCYPILLRLLIWVMAKITPKNKSIQQPLAFLLNHPRRCYTLLFPSTPTWILGFILFALNAIDIILIIVLDLNNPAVNYLEPANRFVAALFQSASARHTGTATFNLANVSPAVQFSLLVMMYVAVYPIAISVRASNAYEDKPVAQYSHELELDDDANQSGYLMKHIRNQLSFDLWYIFLGTFCITTAEAGRIADNADPAFSVFSIMFEVVSGYGNVGLSLGYPTNSASLSGEFTIFSKLVICAMMIRGRHRGLPYALDRAVMLPEYEEQNRDESQLAAEADGEMKQEWRGVPIRKFRTQ
ncbi:unnamed protein product [Cercospora beticola]|nr:unnamed protein product [Cercospora beticola]